MAVVIAPIGLSCWWVVGPLAVTLAAWVLLAHLGAPKAKRVIGAAILAGLVSVAVLEAEEQDFVMVNPCSRYTQSDWQYWAEGCWLP